ncbi:glutamine synthetase family protein [Amycolatopsis taiwanensis]|uniref:Glutamine synthetase GlnA n=1 Tax=Amycolatopsis taiwanensis TaxID=342230 RepID=A0A9W6R161_9PSEU|nr:glutamine synthetase family protein [Amycolatopsis taiwanensis]GLY66751.1 glutamine synthetase GlnA [Amycolatopsis taiwanensis]
MARVKSDLTGARVLTGTIVDPAGVIRAKQVPIEHAGVFRNQGLGASPSWNVFCIDNTVAFTPRFGVVGDLRLRVDPGPARSLGDGLSWAPAGFFTQDGEPAPVCARGRLRQTVEALAGHGLSALVGGELEFVLTRGDGARWESRCWNAYGLAATLDAEPFLLDLVSAAAKIGLPVEQVHAEYGDGQFELSLSPADPVTAADHIVLARVLAGRVARRHGLAVSFSPLPFADGAGNGAHLHVSLSRRGLPVLSGGDGPHGLTGDGAAMIGGIVAGLPDVVGVLAGSVLSAARLRPRRWSGAFACWGLENREAAVRLCAATRGAVHGASVEVKCVDPSANPYLATSVLLGSALDGIVRGADLPPEVTVDPADLPDAVRLPAGQAAALAALECSPLARALLGEELLEAIGAVRHHEVDTYGKVDLAVLAERFRFTW